MPASVVERTLVEMGFDSEMVATAVQLTGGDAEQSVALLFEWGCGQHQLDKPASAWELPGDNTSPDQETKSAEPQAEAEPELWWGHEQDDAEVGVGRCCGARSPNGGEDGFAHRPGHGLAHGLSDGDPGGYEIAKGEVGE